MLINNEPYKLRFMARSYFAAVAKDICEGSLFDSIPKIDMLFDNFYEANETVKRLLGVEDIKEHYNGFMFVYSLVKMKAALDDVTYDIVEEGFNGKPFYDEVGICVNEVDALIQDTEFLYNLLGVPEDAVFGRKNFKYKEKEYKYTLTIKNDVDEIVCSAEFDNLEAFNAYIAEFADKNDIVGFKMDHGFLTNLK
ncbi:MAG: hypothetical protein MJ194_07600, partial [Clostridia bacterium]|nr:hypothetical protein [Clostridia bacterium]